MEMAIMGILTGIKENVWNNIIRKWNKNSSN
jgi:hypothetical protein